MEYPIARLRALRAALSASVVNLNSLIVQLEETAGCREATLSARCSVDFLVDALALVEKQLNEVPLE